MSRIWNFYPQDKPDFILGIEDILIDEKVTGNQSLYTMNVWLFLIDVF